MDEPLNTFPAEPGDPWREQAPAESSRERKRRRLLWRLLALLVVGGVAFAFTTWLLVRVENPASLLRLASEPASVIRAHLEALNRGELRAAYDLFSKHYREQVPFEAYHELVVTHWRIFRTRQVEFGSPSLTGERAVLETRLVASDGEHYLARFTLVRSEGRWWIDDIRWGAESDRRTLVSV